MASGLLKRSDSYKQRLKESLTCSLCFHLYNHSDKQPKGLPCLHTFCKSCLGGYITNTNRKSIRCPICQTTFAVSKEAENDIPTNTNLQDLITLLEEEPIDEESVSRKNALMCNIHPDCSCMIICMHCKVGLCTCCVKSLKSSPHLDHDLEDIGVVFGSLQKKLDTELANLDAFKAKINSLVEVTPEELVSWKKGLQNAVKERTEDYVNKAYIWKDERYKDVQKVVDIIQAERSKQYENISKVQTTELQSQMEGIQQQIQDNDISVFQPIDVVTRKLQELDTAIAEVQFEDFPEMFLSDAKPLELGNFVCSSCDKPTTSGSELTITFTIENISKLRKPVVSPTYQIQSLPWKIVVMSSGQDNGKHLGVFLRCDVGLDATDWMCRAKAQFTLCSPDTTYLYSKSIEHIFFCKEYEWGFKHFIPWDKMCDRSFAYVNGDSITINVHCQVQAPIGL